MCSWFLNVNVLRREAGCLTCHYLVVDNLIFKIKAENRVGYRRVNMVEVKEAINEGELGIERFQECY